MGHKKREEVSYAYVFRTPNAPMQKIRMEKLAHVASCDPILVDAFAGEYPKPQLVIYDDSDSECSFVEMPEAIPCLTYCAPSRMFSPIIALPASEFSRKEPEPLALAAVEVMQHCYDETGAAFDDGVIAPGETWARVYRGDSGNDVYNQVLVSGIPQSPETERLYAASRFDYLSTVLRDNLPYFSKWWKEDQPNKFMEKMSLGMEDPEPYEEWGIRECVVNRKLELRFFDDADVPDVPSLAALDGLPQRAADLLAIWRCGLRGAAIPDFREKHEHAGSKQELAELKELASALGIDSMISAYYAGVPVSDLVPEKYLETEI